MRLYHWMKSEEIIRLRVLSLKSPGSEHVEMWGEWGTWKEHGCFVTHPTFFSLCISSIWLFLSFILV